MQHDIWKKNESHRKQGMCVAHDSRGHCGEEVLIAVAGAAGYIVSTVQKQRKTKAGAWVTFFFIESQTPAHGMTSPILKNGSSHLT